MEAGKFLVEKFVVQGLVAVATHGVRLSCPSALGQLHACRQHKSGDTILVSAGDDGSWEVPGGEVCGAGLGGSGGPAYDSDVGRQPD